ncbi:taste receptor type 2 member 40-like [Brienomyrus brachyistius]|uniref:taste receptor type 2 member 40-like n=1 Tax=Brienomyrus brachyistius TaxID=42636 RepID=UPI0020B1DE0A|nr:taste receptor type 2 member 40-like [Brienomyrus brachyistius]
MVSVGFLWNTLNLVATFLRNLRMANVPTITLVISSISLSNMILELTTFGLVATARAGMWCLGNLHPLTKLVIFCWLHSSCMSFWSISWLSVFYWVKVARASSLLVETVKRNVSAIINTALVLTLLGSTLMLIPMLFLEEQNSTSVTAPTNYTLNVTCFYGMPVFPPWINTNIYTSILIAFLCPLPLMVMLFSSMRLVMYICEHTLSMKRNKTEVQSMDSYLLVCKLTVSLVGVYLTNLAIVALYFIASLTKQSISSMVIMASYSIYCTTTGILLTASNKYLKEMFSEIFCFKKAVKKVGTN